MIYKEEVKDLFSVTGDYYLAHCISADFGMGKGIVILFNEKFDMKNKLKSKYGDWTRYWDNSEECQGDCILEGRVLNLITKRNYWQKPTYKTMRQALEHMRILCENNNIKKLAMPLIGAGLDRLEWSKVSEIIQEVFKNTDIEILVCKI